MTCSHGITYDNRRCPPGGLSWNDNIKACDWTSPTCNCVGKQYQFTKRHVFTDTFVIIIVQVLCLVVGQNHMRAASKFAGSVLLSHIVCFSLLFGVFTENADVLPPPLGRSIMWYFPHVWSPDDCTCCPSAVLVAADVSCPGPPLFSRVLDDVSDIFLYSTDILSFRSLSVMFSTFRSMLG